ncbi:MAG: hypothetical protein IMY76_07770 [Chloroflexi bacterium]|nr:hypothetical protein [Chloroflexota bacterium]
MEAFVAENRIEASCMLACVGSLTKATLRLANRQADHIVCIIKYSA